MSNSAGRHLLVEAGENLFAVDALQVREILEPLPATAVPGAVPAVLGLVNLRGTVMVAADLGALLDLPGAASEEASLVVVDVEGRCLALKVDRLVGLMALSPDADISSGLLEALRARDVVAGVTQFDGRPCFRLDLSEICGRALGKVEEVR